MREPAKQEIDEAGAQRIVRDERERLFELIGDDEDAAAQIRRAGGAERVGNPDPPRREPVREPLDLFKLRRPALRPRQRR